MKIHYLIFIVSLFIFNYNSLLGQETSDTIQNHQEDDDFECIFVSDIPPILKVCDELHDDMVGKKQCTDDTLLHYIYQHFEVPVNDTSLIKYDKRLIVIGFVIKKDGTMTDIKPPTDRFAPNGLTTQRAIEVLTAFSNEYEWLPGIGSYSREAMNVKYHVPIRIREAKEK